MPVITVSKAESKEVEFTASDWFTLPERIEINRVIKSHIKDLSDALPFIIRRVILMGAVPIFDYNFTYDSRVLINQIISGINANNKRLKEKGIRFDDLLQIVPSNIPINVLSLYARGIVLGEDEFLGKPVCDFTLAPLLELTMETYKDFHESSVAALIKSAKYTPSHVLSYPKYKGLPILTLSAGIIEFFRASNIPLPECEYASTPFIILLLHNVYDDFIFYSLGSPYRKERMGETKFIKSRHIRDYITMSKYTYAYKTLFGDSEWDKLKPKNPSLSALINAIPKDRMARVEEEITRQDKFWADLMNNKCPHVDAIRRYHKAVTTAETKSSFDELMTYLDAAQNSVESFAMCKLCGFRLICPHKFVQMDYIINDRSFDHAKRALYQFADEGRNFLVTCKICNEGLYEQQLLDLTGDHVPISLAEDKKALWHDATYMLHTYVKFTESIYDKTNLIRVMVNSSYEHIMGLVSLLPFGTNIEKWRTIYADLIYAAFLLNLDRLSHGKIKFDYRTYLSSVPIANKKKTEKMIEQYRNQLAEVNIVHIEKQLVPKEYILAHPVYIFAAEMTGRDIHSFSGSKKPYEKFPLVEEISVPIPRGGEGYSRGDPLIGGKGIKEVQMREKYGEPTQLKTKSELGRLRDYQMALIYNNLIKYGKGATWKIPGDVAGHNDPSKSDKPTLEKIHKIDALNDAARVKSLMKPVNTMFSVGTADKPIPRDKIKITEIFAPDGSRIKWDKLVYDEKTTVDRKDGSLAKYGKFKDKFSSKWNLLYSEAREMDDTKVREQLENNALMENIINYFFNRCPEGGLHKRNAQGACEKCKMHPTMSADDKREYIIRYKKAYEKNKLEMESSLLNISNSRTMTSAPILQEYPAELTDEMVKIVSERFNAPINIIRHFGLCEGYLFNEIVQGFVEPQFPASTSHPAFSLMSSYISEYFIYKTSKGHKPGALQIIRANIREKSKKIRETEPLMKWMRAVIFQDAIEYHNADSVNANVIMKKLIHMHTLLCKNEPMRNQFIATLDDLLEIDDSKAIDLLEVPTGPAGEEEAAGE